MPRRTPRPPRHLPRGRMVKLKTGEMTPDWARYWHRVLLRRLDQVLEQEEWQDLALTALNRADIDSRLSDVEDLTLQLLASLSFGARIDGLEDITQELEASKWTRTDSDGHLVSVDIVCHNNAVVCHGNSVVYL